MFVDVPLKEKLGLDTHGKLDMILVPGGQVIFHPLVFSENVTGLAFCKLSISTQQGIADEVGIIPKKESVTGTVAVYLYIVPFDRFITLTFGFDILFSSFVLLLSPNMEGLNF